MIKYILVFTLLFSSISNAKSKYKHSVELIGGGITYHVLDYGSASFYSNKISEDGRWIYTPLIGLRFTGYPGNYTYSSAAIFRGTNSVGSPINGALFSSGVDLYGFQLGFAGGGYIQNNEDFKARGLVPYSMTGDTNAFVPILGIEVNYKFDLSDKLFLGIDNLISPVITNHNLSLGMRY